MPGGEQRLDGSPILAGRQRAIAQSGRDVGRRVGIGMRGVATHPAGKRFLPRAIGPVGVVAAFALLGRISTFHPGRPYPALAGAPDHLLRDVGQVLLA